MLVKEAMNKRVKTIRPTSSIKEAAELMNQNHIGSLIAVSGSGSVVGIVTERDIMKCVAAAKNVSETKVQDIMTTRIITIEPYRTLEEAAEIMTKNKIKRLPVIDEGSLVGIITATDLIAYENTLIETMSSLLVRTPKAYGT